MTANAVPINAGRVRRIRKDLALRRVEVLLEVSRRCALATRLDDILAVLIEMTSREIDCDRGTLFLNDAFAPDAAQLLSLEQRGVTGTGLRVLAPGATFSISMALHAMPTRPPP